MRPLTHLPALLLAASMLGGCAIQQRLAQQSATIDSLYVQQHVLRAEIASLQDSLQFCYDVETGQYYRDMRVLQDRITQLTYTLSVLQGGGYPVEIFLAEELFHPASARLSEQGVQHLTVLADSLRARFPNRRFRVEGHADNVPVGPALEDRYPSNWELSAARAAAVVRHLTEQGNLAANQFEVVSYGDTRPAASNETRRGRRLNRRVRIMLLPETPSASASNE